MKKKAWIAGAVIIILVVVLTAGSIAAHNARNINTFLPEEKSELENELNQLEKELKEEVTRNRELHQQIEELKEALRTWEEQSDLHNEEIDGENESRPDKEREVEEDASEQEKSSPEKAPSENNEQNNSSPKKSRPAPGNNPETRNPETNGPVAYLTFDDGPSINTVKILHTLQEYGVQATFFVIGNNVSGDAGIYRRIVREGHALGNHTYTHNFQSIYRSVGAFMDDFLRLEDFLKRETGVKTDMMRFPGGSKSMSAREASGYNIIGEQLITEIKNRGYDYFDWNVSSGDGTANLSAEEIVDNVLEGSKRVTGDIVVLFHDSASRHTTAEALPQVIEELQARGYRFKPLQPGAVNVKHQ